MSTQKKVEERECHWGTLPDGCQNLEWYNSIPYKCINCFDRYLFDASYKSPNESKSDPDTGEIHDRLSDWNQKVKGFQTYIDALMEFMQIQAYRYAFWAFAAYEIFIIPYSKGCDIPNPQTYLKQVGRSVVGFVNGIFPRVLFAVIFSYIVEGVIKHKWYRHRPNMTQDAVADGDRYMGINDLKKTDESYEMYNRSKGPIMGIKSHRSSFPSGHNTGAWTLFAIVLMSGMYSDFSGNKRKPGLLIKFLLLITLAMSLYQVYARVSFGAWHWPSDVIGGIILGFISALFGGWVYNTLKKLGVSAPLVAAICWGANMVLVGIGLFLGYMFGEELLVSKRGVFGIFDRGGYWDFFNTPEDNKLEVSTVEQSYNERGRGRKHNKDWGLLSIPASISFRNQDILIDRHKKRELRVSCKSGFGGVMEGDELHWTPAGKDEIYGTLEPGAYHKNGKTFYENARIACLEENEGDPVADRIADEEAVGLKEKEGGGQDIIFFFTKIIVPSVLYMTIFAVPLFLWQVLYNRQQTEINTREKPRDCDN